MTKTLTVDHPGQLDEHYLARRNRIASRAAGRGQPPAIIEYEAREHQVWADVQQALAPALDRHACHEVLEARANLGLNLHRIEQLADVSARLEPLTGFHYEAVPGLVSKEEFFAALANRRFLSTQFVRHHARPHYTPEPDVIHEVIGHATCLAVPQLAELHHLAGEAIVRSERPETRQMIADVFWFSGEFGVVREGDAWKAYGAGLLSSVGELEWFSTHARIEPLDPIRMSQQPYDITTYQPTLFAAQSLTHLLETLAPFFESVSK